MTGNSLTKFQHKTHRSTSWIPFWLCSFLPVLPDVLSPAALVVAASVSLLVPKEKNSNQFVQIAMKETFLGHFTVLCQ
jgi:hypothetical protein